MTKTKEIIDYVNIKPLTFGKDEERRLLEICNYYMFDLFRNIEVLNGWVLLRPKSDIIDITNITPDGDNVIRIHWCEFIMNMLPKFMYGKEGKKEISLYTAMLAFSLADSERLHPITLLYYQYIETRKKKYGDD